MIGQSAKASSKATVSNSLQIGTKTSLGMMSAECIHNKASISKPASVILMLACRLRMLPLSPGLVLHKLIDGQTLSPLLKAFSSAQQMLCEDGSVQ